MIEKEIKKQIQGIMIDKDYKKGELADKCGWSISNMSNKLSSRNKSFSTKDLEVIAEALGCNLQINFVNKEQ